jgi:hypothetical protein
MMERIARVSAVFLLVSAVWVCGVLGDAVDRRGASAQVPKTKDDVGVGTNSGTESEKVRGVAEKQDAAVNRPREVFRAVEMGWRTGTPKPFERHLGKGKVWLDFGEGGLRGGLYGKSQTYYMLADYLKRKPTVSTSMIKMSEKNGKNTRPYARFESTYRYKTGPNKKEVIFVSLVLEDNRWVISEIRAVPAK